MTRQQTRFIALMEGYEQAQKYASAAADSAGVSAQKLAVYQESVEAKTNRAMAAFENFSMTLIDSNLIGFVMDLGTNLFNALAAFDAWPAKIAALAAGIIAAKTAFDSLKGAGIATSIKTTIGDLAERTGMVGASNVIIAASLGKEAA